MFNAATSRIASLAAAVAVTASLVFGVTGIAHASARSAAATGAPSASPSSSPSPSFSPSPSTQA